MGFKHNLMAHQVSAVLLQQLRAGSAHWSHERLTTKVTLWQGMSDWPRPDIAFEDRSTQASLALEFKPPNQSKREYVTGLGQALTYLNDFEFSGLVLPEFSSDGFQIADYFRDMLARDLTDVPIALFSYQRTPTKLSVLRPLTARRSPPGKLPAGIGRKVFWGYWRDLSNYDLLVLLDFADKHERGGFERVFLTFWKKVATKGKARTWENKARKPKSMDAPSFDGEKINAVLAVRHSGLMSSDGRLTAEGHDLLRVGKIYGADSRAFLEQLALQVLTVGRHMDLIFWVEEQQRSIPAERKSTASDYYDALDHRLVDAGIIATRPETAAKAHFLRDEPKLWNKLGLLMRYRGQRYFHPGHGLAFNWRQIVSVLEAAN